jgi:hypothetical protein
MLDVMKMALMYVGYFHRLYNVHSRICVTRGSRQHEVVENYAVTVTLRWMIARRKKLVGLVNTDGVGYKLIQNISRII